MPDEQTRRFYLHSLELLEAAQVPHLVGGGYAMACYTGIFRHTKDLDIFVRPQDRQKALASLADAGYKTEITWPHFLAKAITEYAFVDLIYNSGNGLCPVDDEWLKHARDGEVLGRRVRLCPPEESLSRIATASTALTWRT